MKYLFVVMALFIVCARFAVAHEMDSMDQADESFMLIEHIASIVLAVITVSVGIISYQKLNASSKGTAAYLIAGVASFGFAHVSEVYFDNQTQFIFPSMVPMTVEHVLGYAGFILISLGFYRWMNTK